MEQTRDFRHFWLALPFSCNHKIRWQPWF